MKRVKTGLLHLSQIPVETDVPDRPGVTRQLLYKDEETGSKTRILTFPPNYRSARSWENDGLMESHKSSEEILVLEGVLSFGRWYDLPGLGYTFHPPGWIHPADQQSEFGHRMLIKSGEEPVDFTFTPPPANWDGAEFSLLDTPGSRTNGVTRRNVESVPKLPLLFRDGSPSGLYRQPLFHGGPDGWSTWMLVVPPQWSGDVNVGELVFGGLEFFVISGDLTAEVDENLVELTSGNYFCDPDRVALMTASAFSRQGCYAICWTRELAGEAIPSQ